MFRLKSSKFLNPEDGLFKKKKKIIIKKKAPTTVQICKLENIEHKSMK